MSTIDITYGTNEGIKQIEVPVISLIEMQLKSVLVIKNLLAGTDSNEWLIASENG